MQISFVTSGNACIFKSPLQQVVKYRSHYRISILVLDALILKVLVTKIDALGHFKQDNYSTVGEGWWGTSRHYFPHARP